MKAIKNKDEVGMAGNNNDTASNAGSQLGDGKNVGDATALAAEQAAYIQPSEPRKLGGRLILALQALVNKVFAGRIVQIQDQVIDQDRELSDLAHDLAELSTLVGQLNRQQQAINKRLAKLETSDSPAGEE